MLSLPAKQLFDFLVKEDAIVFFHKRDALWEDQLRNIPNLRCQSVSVEIKNKEDAEFIQICKIPQIRVYKKQIEAASFVGVASPEDIKKLTEFLL